MVGSTVTGPICPKSTLSENPVVFITFPCLAEKKPIPALGRTKNIARVINSESIATPPMPRKNGRVTVSSRALLSISASPLPSTSFFIWKRRSTHVAETRYKVKVRAKEKLMVRAEAARRLKKVRRKSWL